MSLREMPKSKVWFTAHAKPHSSAEEELIPPALGTLLAIKASKPHGKVQPRFFMQDKMPFKKLA